MKINELKNRIRLYDEEEIGYVNMVEGYFKLSSEEKSKVCVELINYHLKFTKKKSAIEILKEFRKELKTFFKDVVQKEEYEVAEVVKDMLKKTKEAIKEVRNRE